MRKSVLFSVIALFVLSSCSTTKLIPEGQYRLDSNIIEIEGDNAKLKKSLNSYIRQSPNKKGLFGMAPVGLLVYNWSNGSGKGINRVWENLGTEPVIFDEGLVSNSNENLLNRLRFLGYYNAKVSSEVVFDEAKKLASVHYYIKPGNLFSIDSLVFDIPEGSFYEDFLRDTSNITIKEGVYLSEQLLDSETQRGASYFRNLGYYDFNKNNYFFTADTVSVEGKTILHYSIKPYTRNEVASEDKKFRKYTIEKISFEYPGDMHLNRRKLLKLNPISKGMLYSEDIVNLAYNRFTSSNTFNSVNIELSPLDSTSLACEVKLKGFDRYGVKLDAELSTNSTGLLGISPKISFYHKNIFRGGERLNLDFSGNWQYHPRTKAYSNTLGASASILFPRALGFNANKTRKVVPKTEVKISYNYQNRPEFVRNVFSVSYGYNGQFNPNFLYQIYPLQLSTTRIFDISNEFLNKLFVNKHLTNTFSDIFDLGVGINLTYNTDPVIVPKTSYFISRLSVDASGNLLSLFNKSLPISQEDQFLIFGLPYEQYIRAELTLIKAFRFGKNEAASIAFRLNGGIAYAYGNSYVAPFEKQFYCGGANSMRAWQSRTLGPADSPIDLSDFFIIPSQTGDKKIEADVELRFPIFWKLEGGVFVETGNIWYTNPFTKDFFSQLAADYGLGLRVNLDMILLRVDAGFKLHDPSREIGSRWLTPKQMFSRDGFAVHFGVGYPF